MKQLTDDIQPGQIVGWEGMRVIVERPGGRGSFSRMVKVRKPGDLFGMWVKRAEITAAPPLPEHVDQAATGLAGFIKNPQRIFGDGEDAS